MPSPIVASLIAATSAASLLWSTLAIAQETLPWSNRTAANDAYTPREPSGSYGQDSVYRPVQSRPLPGSQGEYDASAGGASPEPDGVYRPRGRNDAYAPPPSQAPQSADRGYPGGTRGDGQYGQPYGEPYAQPRGPQRDTYDDGSRGRFDDGRGRGDEGRSTFTQNEIMRTGHSFFGSVSQGLASAVEYVFQRAGRPNGYILGEDAGGAFVAGLRYGEGRLYTKDAGEFPVFWQGPSLGYDFGGEGSKTMVLVYNLRDPSEIYNRFGGVQGSAYLVGGVSVQFQKFGDVVLAPIRSGVGLRLGANVGYLKYTRSPTWNPF